MRNNKDKHTAQPFLCIKQAPSAKAEMLIRKSVEEVFEAFVNPAITAKFWFTKGSDRLQVGKQIRWDWEMYGHSVQVNVKEIEKNKRIVIEWSLYKTTLVEWQFTSLAIDETFVSVTNTGFIGDGDEIIEQALSSTEGFTIMLAGAKAFLEHNIILNLVVDRFPDKVNKH
ncbi:SRPBCC family protein [Rickettsia endosymbiont of Ceutorhynchus obstrictus]|uniref:SRPBCC family protein n=1 Tax=Rickettsia endosymbiont of Ceutorhynchus obstrictus TaxID=3066249 RepID=UPI00313304A8